MGGYARYVWSAFGVSFIALLVLFWQTRRAYRDSLSRVARYLESTSGESS